MIQQLVMFNCTSVIIINELTQSNTDYYIGLCIKILTIFLIILYKI